jgi:predicted GTPase
VLVCGIPGSGKSSCIVANFRENWESLTDLEKRQFLTKFIKKIILVNEPIEGTNKGHTVITKVEFCGE